MDMNQMTNTAMRIGNHTFDLYNRTYIMAILNVTPDSFSDGGSYHSLDDVLYRVEQMIGEGAHIIDVGGESTRPGHIQIEDEEEISRVVPAIEAITKRFDIPISIDTYKPAVAKAALAGGAHMVNDIWGLQYDGYGNGQAMADVIAQADASCCLMHNKANTEYQSLIPECIESLQRSADIALRAGVAKDKIMLDPGVGFGKTYTQNLHVLQQLQKFSLMGYPMLLGTSRKSVIGLTLDLPTDQRVEGTLATTVMAVMAGWNFVRVHDIKENARTIKMVEAILHCNQ